MFTLGHLSDWHTTSPNDSGAGPLLNKRILGWLSWNTRRKHLYRPEVLDALIDDLTVQRPDHVAITGDLTNVGLEAEFSTARRWLERIGVPETVSLIPGNHDAYVRETPGRSWDHWAEYLAGDAGRAAGPRSSADYPTCSVRDPVAIVGLCSAEPTAPFLASGSVGRGQLERLSGLLAELRERRLFRVVLVHHPPAAATESWRRRLRDHRALCDVIAREGAELVLHGHRHRSVATAIPNASPSIPVVGVCSASYAGELEERHARYHLYRIGTSNGPDGAPRFSIRAEMRKLDLTTGRFVPAGELALPA